MSYIFHNDISEKQSVSNKITNEKINDLENAVLDLIVKVDKLSKELKPEKKQEKPVDLVELYGLKPLSFYKEE